MPKKTTYPKKNTQPTLKKRKSMKKKNHLQTGGKKKLNEFFKTMLKAKKQDLESFKYKGKTYKRVVAKTGLKLYKKA